MLGWCMTGFHEGKVLKGPGTTCPGEVEHKGKKLPCDCECHGGRYAPTPMRETDDSLERSDVLVSEGGGEEDLQMAPPPQG